MVADKQPFKGVENYFKDFLLYQDFDEPPIEELESGNEADSEPEYGDSLILKDFKSIVIGYESHNITDAV